MNIKSLLNMTLALTIATGGYKEITAMNAAAPMSFTRYAGLGLLGYSSFWMEQCIIHGNAKTKQDIPAMNTANKLLAASLAVPLGICAIAPIMEAGIKKTVGTSPTRFSRASLVGTLLIAGIPGLKIYTNICSKNKTEI